MTTKTILNYSDKTTSFEIPTTKELYGQSTN